MRQSPQNEKNIPSNLLNNNTHEHRGSYRFEPDVQNEEIKWARYGDFLYELDTIDGVHMALAILS